MVDQIRGQAYAYISVSLVILNLSHRVRISVGRVEDPPSARRHPVLELVPVGR